MSTALITESLLTNIANAIRAKAGTNQTFTPAQMVTAIQNIPAGISEDNIIERNVSTLFRTSSIYNETVSFIGQGAFAYTLNLKKVTFTACEKISAAAFVYCKSLSSANFPECSLIAESAFLQCASLTTISFPKCQVISMVKPL